MPGDYDLRLYEGSTTLNIDEMVWKPDGVAPANLTGCRALLTIFDDQGVQALQLDSAVSGEITITALEGKLSDFNKAIPAFPSWRRGWYVLEIYFPAPATVPKRLMQGLVLTFPRTER